MRKRKMKQKMAAMLCMTLAVSSIATPSTTAFAAAAANETQSITLNVDSEETMYVGMSEKIKVKSVQPKNGSKKVTYESSNPEVVKIYNNGTMKAMTEGEAVITVTSAANQEVSEEVEVNVKNLVKNKTYNKMVIPLDKKNKTRKLSKVSKVKASYLKITTNKRSVATVSNSGVIVGKKAGTAKITIKGKKSIVKGAKQVINLYVAKKSVESVVLDKTSTTLKPGDSIKLITTVTPKNAANVVVFKTSDEDVATVAQNGKVTAVKEGTAEITATTVDGSKEAVCVVTVSNGTTEVKPGTTTEDKTEATTGEKPGTTTEDKTEATTGEKPETSTEDKTEATTGEKPGTTTEDKTEATTGEKPGTSTEDKTEATTGEKPGTTTEDKTEATTGEKPGSTTEDKTEATTGENSGSTTEDKTEATTGENSGSTTETKTEATTGENSGSTTEDKTEATTGENSGNTTENKTEATTGESSGTTTEDKTEATTEEVVYTNPVTVEQLEAKFPSEPDYPALNLQDDYTKEVNLKDDLLSLDVPAGTIVKTKGYYAVNDGGQAVYEIMTYDDWWEQLPLELKMVHYHNNKIGAGQVLYKNPADNYGNHRLDNGMVAKLLPNEDGYVRVEQWGLFSGRDDNNRALIQIFANNHTDSKILFGKDAEYVLHYDTKNQAYQNQNGIIENVPTWLSLNSIGNNGNEYAVVLHCRQTAKPAIGDAQNVELIGNGCTISIPDNEFCNGNTADFAMFETGGYVDGLSIHGFNFDSNGLQQYQYYDESKESYVQMRTTNHTISYFSSGLNLDSADKPLKDGNGEEVLGEITGNDLKKYRNRDKTCFNNVEIYGNTFLANGTSVNISDGGGDDILIINPEESNNVNIHNNKMYNWGRWAFAVDLGGNGERFYNYTFKQNICIQDDTNVTCTVDGETATPTTSHRGLGWIDFEARKCFTNLDVSENYVYGANGWAFNGNGKISENITINANTIERPSYGWRSIYPYAFEFYSVYAKDLKVTNNKVTNGGGVNWGKLSYNFLLENNDLGGASFGIVNPLGSVTIRNNTTTGVRGQSYSITASKSLPWVESEDSEFYLSPEERKADVLFEGNSTGGVVSNIVVTDPANDYRKNITLTFRENRFSKFVVNAIGIKDFYFTPDQLIQPDSAWSARGCKYASPVISRASDNPVPGGLYYKEGDLVTESLDKITRLYGPKYFSELFPDMKNANGSIKKDQDMYCTKEGVFPLNGEFLNAEADAYFTANTNYSAGKFIYTEDNLYYVVTAGTSGADTPTHTSGIVTNGTAELMWVAPIARYEMRDKPVSESTEE